jgi:flagellar protein FlgJ
MTKQELISKYYPSAVAATKGSGIFAETLLSQLILESGYNLSTLATQSNNFFGIKATPTWLNKVVSKSTYEYLPNKVLIQGTGNTYNNYASAIAAGANKMSLFRVYATPIDGFKGYVNFLKSNPRYKALFKATTPQQQFTLLQQAGYATSNTYANDLLSVYNSIKDYLPTIVATAATGSLFAITAILIYFAIKN